MSMSAVPQPMPLLPHTWARAQRIVACRQGDVAEIVFSARTPGWALAEAQRQTAIEARREVPDEEIDALLSAGYAETGSAAAVVGAAESEVDLERLMQSMPAVTDLLDAQDDAPVIRMINALLAQAARDGASDVHFEAFETHSVVRYRVDGTLRDVVSPRKELHAALISRIKIMSQLDIAEKRVPQDGRITLRVGGRPIDVRVSTVPTVHGERAVLRLLEKDAGRLQLQRLGLAQDTLETLTKLIRQPHGIVLVTGPTGSGKTTTLYAALGQLDKSVSNILSVEDPVEYDLPGVNQIPVHSKIGMTFGAALRAALRQDPDNIMIGEIRDLETAQIAVQSSLTGHGVLASLHTNDAISAVTRLTDMGIEPFLLSSSLLGVLAQRLIRCLCPQCKRAEAQPDGSVRWVPVGCAHCNQSGFKGRTGIHELFVIDDEVRRVIHDGGNEHAMRELARRSGMRTMREDGQRWVAAGVSTADEILRVTREDG
jgi:general secretion pathway protein E